MAKEKADYRTVEQISKLLRQLSGLSDFKRQITAKTSQIAEQIMLLCDSVTVIDNLIEVTKVICSDQPLVKEVFETNTQEKLVASFCILLESESTGLS